MVEVYMQRNTVFHHIPASQPYISADAPLPFRLTACHRCLESAYTAFSWALHSVIVSCHWSEIANEQQILLIILGMPDKTEDASISVIRIDHSNPSQLSILLIHGLIPLIEVKQILTSSASLDAPPQPEDTSQVPFLAPFPKLCELLPHKEKLFARMPHHKSIALPSGWNTYLLRSQASY